MRLAIGALADIRPDQPIARTSKREFGFLRSTIDGRERLCWSWPHGSYQAADVGRAANYTSLGLAID